MLLISGSPRVHLTATVTNPTFRPDPRGHPSSWAVTAPWREVTAHDDGFLWKIGEDQGFREDFRAR